MDERKEMERGWHILMSGLRFSPKMNTPVRLEAEVSQDIDGSAG